MLNKPDLVRLRTSTRAVFFLTGTIFALWSGLIPVVKHHVGLNNDGLGVLLLCLGIGSMLGMPIAGILVERFGCRTVILGGLTLAGLVLLPLSLLSNGLTLAIGLFSLGAGLGAVETTVNIQAVFVEQQGHTPALSGFHAFFSIGGVIGAGCAPLFSTIGASPWMTIVTGQLCIALIALWCSPNLLLRPSLFNTPQRAGRSNFALPHGIIWMLGALTSAVFLAEGAVLDWGGLFLDSERADFGIQPGWGYAVFSIAMTAARLTGDRIITLLGRPLLVCLGGLSASCGFLLVVYGPGLIIVMSGFLLIGLGCANIVPALYTATGKQSAMTISTAIAAITTMGYAGILLGPAFIGAFAHRFSLAAAFVILAVLMGCVATCCRITL